MIRPLVVSSRIRSQEGIEEDECEHFGEFSGQNGYIKTSEEEKVYQQV